MQRRVQAGPRRAFSTRPQSRRKLLQINELIRISPPVYAHFQRHNLGRWPAALRSPSVINVQRRFPRRHLSGEGFNRLVYLILSHRLFHFCILFLLTVTRGMCFFLLPDMERQRARCVISECFSVPLNAALMSRSGCSDETNKQLFFFSFFPLHTWLHKRVAVPREYKFAIKSWHVALWRARHIKI